VTRALLSITICVLCLGLGLVTTHLQSENHARAARLDGLKHRCDLIEAGNEVQRYEIHLRLTEVERSALAMAPREAELPTR
jgi:hypothetical protein